MTGEEIASLEVRDEVLGVSAAGRYLGVLYMDRVVIYNRELESTPSAEGHGYARTVLMRQDGTALLLAARERPTVPALRGNIDLGIHKTFTSKKVGKHDQHLL